MSKQMNDQKGSFQAKKIKNDVPLPAYAHADAINHENERPKEFSKDKRKFNE